MFVFGMDGDVEQARRRQSTGLILIWILHGPARIACVQDLLGGTDARLPCAVRGREIAAGAGFAGEEESAVHGRCEHRAAVSHSGNRI